MGEGWAIFNYILSMLKSEPSHVRTEQNQEYTSVFWVLWCAPKMPSSGKNALSEKICTDRTVVGSDPVNLVDLTGKNPLAIAGAIIGAGVNAYANYDRLSGWDYAASIATGALIGAAAGFAPGILAGSLAGGAAAGANEFVTQSLEMNDADCGGRGGYDVGAISTSFGLGLIAGGISGVGGTITKNVGIYTNSSPWIGGGIYTASENAGGIVGNIIGTVGTME